MLLTIYYALNEFNIFILHSSSTLESNLPIIEYCFANLQVYNRDFRIFSNKKPAWCFSVDYLPRYFWFNSSDIGANELIFGPERDDVRIAQYLAAANHKRNSDVAGATREILQLTEVLDAGHLSVVWSHWGDNFWELNSRDPVVGNVIEEELSSSQIIARIIKQICLWSTGALKIFQSVKQ